MGGSDHHGHRHRECHAESEQIAAQRSVTSQAHHDGDPGQRNEAGGGGADADGGLLAHRQPAECGGKEGNGGVDHGHVRDGGGAQRRQKENHPRR
jgi:hypothetical protein